MGNLRPIYDQIMLHILVIIRLFCLILVLFVVICGYVTYYGHNMPIIWCNFWLYHVTCGYIVIALHPVTQT